MTIVKILDLVLKSSNTVNKDNVIRELIKHIDNNNNYDYDNQKQNHIIEMLADDSVIVRPEDINIDYIINNLSKFIYKAEDYIIKNINIKYVDNISCYVKLTYEYIEKINEDRVDINFTESNFNVSFIDHPEVLKKS